MLESSIEKDKIAGLNILITGNVPIAAGLSSSASLVVCSGFMTLFANKLQSQFSQQTLIERLIKYERSLGTACGGMDQSISVLARTGQALYIQFDPLDSEPVLLPKGVSKINCYPLFFF